MDIKISNIFLMIILANLIFNVPFTYGQEQFLCPKHYETKERKIALQDQHLTKSPVISKVVCSYFEQNTSRTVFEIRWSPNGNLHTGEWCEDKLSIENGIAKYLSDSHYIEISATGILPTEYNDAKDFIQLLFVVVKNDAKSCHMKEDHTINERPQQINSEIDSVTIPDNKTTSEQLKQIVLEDDYEEEQFPIVGIIAGTAIAIIGYITIKRFKSKQ